MAIKINAKPFKAWEKQLEILDGWFNKKINKDPDVRRRAEKYLKDYNFQVCVDAFAPLLWKNFNDGVSETDLKFDENFNFNDLELLYKFDCYLKDVINTKIEIFEKKLKTGIIYHLMSKLKDIYFRSNSNLPLFPFISLDNDSTDLIKRFVFRRNEFKTNKKYFSFIKRLLTPFNKYDSIYADYDTFYFSKIHTNYVELDKNERNSSDNKTNRERFNSYYLGSSATNDSKLEINYNNNIHSLDYSDFLTYIKDEYHKPGQNDVDFLSDTTFALLSKSFIPLYKSLTVLQLGDVITLFSKFNEKLQLKIIEEHFSSFTSHSIVQNANDTLKISLFLSFARTFKHLRNKIAHYNVIFNFWSFFQPNKREQLIKENNIYKDTNLKWYVNKDLCDLLNEKILNKNFNSNINSNYFIDLYNNQKNDNFYYLNKLAEINLLVYCNLTTNNNDVEWSNQWKTNKTLWYIPLFLLNDSIHWLNIFIGNKNTFEEEINSLLNSQFSKLSEEIKKRLKDVLFGKIFYIYEKK